MRRKSSRNARNPSPEKAKPETTRRSSRRQSSRRRKRSSSRSSESEELPSETKDTVQVRTTNSTPSTDVKSESDSKAGEKSIDSLVSDKSQEETNVDNKDLEKTTTSDQVSEKEDNKDSQEWKEEVEDMEESKNKGKSKGKNNTNFEQSSNYIEPETENVQGTHQSPSNDNADNENVVQNVNDTETLNPEAPEDKSEDNVVTENEDQQQKNAEAGFVSEYAQINESSQSNEIQSSNEKTDISHKSSDEEKSTASDRKNNNKNSSQQRDNKLDEEKDKPEHPDSSSSRKKITLRRSPPENKESEKIVTSESSVQNNEKSNESKQTEETKPSSKKITLKRHTTDDNSSAGEETKRDIISRSLSEEVVQRKRRLSSVGDDVEHNRAEKQKKITKPVKLIRTLSRDGVNDEEKTKRIAMRRQRWGRSDWLNKLTSSFYKVDVESIKIVCPSLEFLGENEINFETAPKERRRSESEHKRKLSIDNRSEDSDRPEYEKQTSEESSGDPKVETNQNIIAMNRKISIVDDTASKLKPPPSPAKNPTSDVLFITNLVRPFTVKQLKELLERTGKIKEEGFWTDRIKSKCYVQYETVEEAEATRNALHGVHWPIGNGKQLVIDYATEEDLEKAKNPAPAPVVAPEKLPEKENREPDDKFQEQQREERRKRDGAVREWDVGKEDSHRRFSRSRSRERSRKHSRRSYTPEGYINSKKQRKSDDAVPQKLMDDLFLKTKATPSIYWQPLTPEEIALKQQQRLVRMEEHKRRIEENRGRAREGRRVPFRRR